MLRAARLLQRAVARAAAGGGGGGGGGGALVLRSSTTTTATTTVGVARLHGLVLRPVAPASFSSSSAAAAFATKARKQQGGEEAGSSSTSTSGGGSSKKRDSVRQKLKKTPVDPRLYQHLERLGLGAESTRRPRKGQRRKKQRVTVDMDKIEARLKREAIPYFQANRFTQAKRALRRERRRLVREASTRLHLLNRAQVERAGAAASAAAKTTAENRQAPEQGRGGDGVAAAGEGGGAGAGASDRARELARLFRASAASGAVRFATPALAFADLPPPLLTSTDHHHQQQRGRGGRSPRVVPEVALAGRSNVGKSTLLNALLGLHARRGAAAVGDRPGVTQSLDFYRVGSRHNPRLVVVDLPGYGFAYGQEARVGQAQQLTLDYLRHRGAPLKRLLLLLDARHGLKRQDRVFLRRLFNPSVSVSIDREDDDDDDDDDSSAEEAVAFDDSAAAELEADGEASDEDEDEEGMATPPAPASAAPLPPFRPPKLQIVFTKCDLLPRDELAKRILFVRRELEGVGAGPLLLMTLQEEEGEGEGEGVMALGVPRAAVAGLPSLMVAAGRGRKGLAELQAELAALLPPAPPRAAASSTMAPAAERPRAQQSRGPREPREQQRRQHRSLSKKPRGARGHDDERRKGDGVGGRQQLQQRQRERERDRKPRRQG